MPTHRLAGMIIDTLRCQTRYYIYGHFKDSFFFLSKKSVACSSLSAALFPRKIDTRPCAGTNLMPSIYPVVNNQIFHKLDGPWNVSRIRLRARPLLWISLSFRLTESVWVGVSREREKGRRNVKANSAKKTSTTWPKTPPCPRKASKNSTRQVVDVRYDHFSCNQTKVFADGEILENQGGEIAFCVYNYNYMLVQCTLKWTPIISAKTHKCYKNIIFSQMLKMPVCTVFYVGRCWMRYWKDFLNNLAVCLHQLTLYYLNAIVPTQLIKIDRPKMTNKNLWNIFCLPDSLWSGTWPTQY